MGEESLREFRLFLFYREEVEKKNLTRRAWRGLRPQPKTEYLAQRSLRTQRKSSLYLSFSATFAPSAREESSPFAEKFTAHPVLAWVDIDLEAKPEDREVRLSPWGCQRERKRPGSSPSLSRCIATSAALGSHACVALSSALART